MGFRQAFSLIDPSVAVPRAISFEPGLYVNAGCSLGAASEFGQFVFINRGASVGHNAHFKAFVSIGPGAVIAGSVTIGQGSMVGAGAVVTHNVADHCMVIGNPARVVKTGISGYNGATVI